MMKSWLIALLVWSVCIISSMPSQLLAAEMGGVMMKDGKMMKTMDGKPTGTMDHEMTMRDGTKVMPNGMVKMKDGKEMMMQEGQMMMMDGMMKEGGKAMPMQK